MAQLMYISYDSLPRRYSKNLASHFIVKFKLHRISTWKRPWVMSKQESNIFSAGTIMNMTGNECGLENDLRENATALVHLVAPQ
jgi:hypothetical protein